MKRTLAAIRGLTLGLSISFFNLVGMFFMLLLLGGLGEWSTMQFVGAFGIFEIATAIAFIFCPNIWRMPVIEAETGMREKTSLAASALLIPHWAGGAKAVAGGGMPGAALYTEGFGPATAGVIPFALATALLVIAISAAAARFGVVRPHLDVVHVVLKRPQRDDIKLPGISLSASVLQIVLGAFTLPVVKVLPPSTLYQPEVGPSAAFLALTTAVAGASVALALWAWRGHIAVRATREHQRKAEERV